MFQSSVFFKWDVNCQKKKSKTYKKERCDDLIL